MKKESLDILNKNILIQHTGFKICQTCKEVKTTDEYYANCNSFDGKSATCKVCKTNKSSTIFNSPKIDIEYTKLCLTCNSPKKGEEFFKNPKNKDGLSSYCKNCNTNRVADWAYKNSDKNREYRRNYTKIRKKEEPLFKLCVSIRNLIGLSFKRALNGKYKKSINTENLLGCTVSQLIEYLQSLFAEGMSLENHGQCEECWHIDHKYPISLAKTQEEIIKLCHYTNLQPLWSRENIKKGNNIDNKY